MLRLDNSRTELMPGPQNPALFIRQSLGVETQGRIRALKGCSTDLRAGHQFRAGIVKPEHYPLLSGVELVGADPKHAIMLHEILDELGDGSLIEDAKTKGVVTVFLERKEEILRLLREVDPAHWDTFVESQVMARAVTC